MVSFRSQQLIHWMEYGQGKRVLSTALLVAFIGLFSWYHCFKRFAGPSAEYPIEDAIIGKQLAENKGFTTQIRYLQTVVFLERKKGYSFDPEQPLPDLYHAPLYPLAIAAGLRLLPSSVYESVWEDPASEAIRVYPAYNADYFLLVINMFFFLAGGAAAYVLARMLASPFVGVLSLLGILFSVGIWDSVLALNGASMLLFLVLIWLILWVLLERWRALGKSSRASVAVGSLFALGIGAVGALIFLTDYSAGLLLLVFPVYACISYRRRHAVVVVSLALLGFSLVAGPWCVRNVHWTGHPLALAGQNFRLKAGDPTAEPITFRKSSDADGPELSFRKIINKGLKGIEENSKNKLWSGGAFFFAAFFLTGCLYRFRRTETNRFRWIAAVLLAVMLLVQPFLVSGESDRFAAAYLAPLMVIFGSAFFVVILESTGRRTEVQRILFSAALLLIHALPLLHNLAEPRRVPFTYPPYYPSLMARLRFDLSNNFRPGYGMMADIPAGTAWYSQQPIWAQPDDYADFVQVLLRQNIGALFLSPQVLDRPYFAKLLRAEHGVMGTVRKEAHWGAVYGGLQHREIPDFFPLQNVQPLNQNIYLLLNPLAWRGSGK